MSELCQSITRQQYTNSISCLMKWLVDECTGPSVGR